MASDLITILSDAVPRGSPGKPCKLRSPEVSGAHENGAGKGVREVLQLRTGEQVSFVKGTGAGSQEAEVPGGATATCLPPASFAFGDPLGFS